MNVIKLEANVFSMHIGCAIRSAKTSIGPYKVSHAYMRAVLKVRVEDIGSGSHGSYDMGALLPIYSEKIVKEAYSVLSTQQKTNVLAVCGHDELRDKDRFQTFKRGLGILVELWNYEAQ